MMTPVVGLAEMPVTQGLVYLLQQQSADIDRKYRRFLASGDAEALHDFRVSLRRLRALFSGFSSCFIAETALPEQLRSLQQETNRARDLEVLLSLIERWELPIPGLQQQWQEELAKEYFRLQQQLPMHWQELLPALQAPEHLLSKTLPPTALGSLTADIEDKAASKLFKEIAAQKRKWRKRRAHKLRIRGKRLRYLIEPFSGESKEVAAAARQLRQLQDLLGDYHDILVLRQRINTAIKDNLVPQSDRPKRARRLLKQRASKVRKRFLKRYDGKPMRKLHQHLQHTSKALA